MTDNHFSRWISVRIVLIYIVFGCLWVLLSDWLILQFGGDPEKLTSLQNYKGLLFILATAFFLHALINHAVRTIKNNEIANRQTDRRYEELIENANDVIYTLDENGKFSSVNSVGEKVFGYRRAELLKLNLADIVAPDYQKYVHRLTGRAVRDDRPVYEMEFIKKDDRRVLLEINTHRIEQEGEKFEMLGIARDITEQQQAREKLRQSEERYRRLVETANEGIIIIDQEGVITFINPKMAEMLDYDPEEILDNFIFDFIDDDSRREAEKRMEARRAGVKGKFDFRFKKFDGSDLWTIVSSSPIMEADQYRGSVAMVTDITERKLAENAAASERRINNATIDSLPGVFYFYDETGKFLRWNRNFEVVSGYTGEEIKNMHPLDFFTGDDKEILRQKIDEVLRTGISFVEAPFTSKDGSSQPYFFTGKRLMLDDKPYLIGMGVDISDCDSVRNFKPE